MLQNAGTTIKHTAQDNIEITAKENQIIVVEDENMEITVEGPGGFRIHIKNDALHIQSAKETRIEGNGGGDITLHQSGGGVCVTAGGNIKLFGNDIQIEGDNGVSLNGTVRYTIGSGVVPAPEVEDELTPSIFALLMRALSGSPICIPCLLGKLSLSTIGVDTDSPVIYDLGWNQPRAPVGEAVKIQFKAQNLNDSEQININVYEWDPDGKKQLLPTINTQFKKDISKYELDFVRTEDESRDDLANDQKDGDKTPIAYRFDISSASFSSDATSPILNLTSDMTFDLVDDNKQMFTGDIQVECLQADGEVLMGQTSTGSITFEDVLLGPIELEVRLLDDQVEEGFAKFTDVQDEEFEI